MTPVHSLFWLYKQLDFKYKTGGSCADDCNNAEKLMVALRDGRKLIGVLRSWDQFGAFQKGDNA